jgi:poly(beta-D-mannuronate) lyase
MYQAVDIGTTGTATHPIVISATHLEKAVFASGTVHLSGAAYTTLSGFTFSGSSFVQMTACNHCRVTASWFKGSAANFVDILGPNSDANRVDHSEFGPKAQQGHFIHVSGTAAGIAAHTQIDHNYFHDIASGSQGGESIQLGAIGPSGDYQNIYTIIEDNLFVNCDGDAEIISVKSSSNTIRYNTIKTSTGMIVLRAGNNDSVYGNFILGGGKAGAGGIRLYENNHTIYNNYIETVDQPLIVGGGSPAGTSGGHAQVKNARIVNNTFIGQSNGVIFGFGSDAVLPPDHMAFANNIVQVGGGTAIDARLTPTSPTYVSNILSLQRGAKAGISGSQFHVQNPKLTRVGAILKLSSSSPAIKAGSKNYPFVADDVDGQPRATPPDIGADQFSSAPVIRVPLTPANVGPNAP